MGISQEFERGFKGGATTTERGSGAESHLELALKHLEEDRGFVEKDLVQASGKLYKATEEAVKALTLHFNLGDVLADVGERGS